jgi:hypothetical protein
MNMKLIADNIHDNGYMPIPLVPMDKAIKIEAWTLLAAQDEYEKLWRDAATNANIGIYTGQNVIIADFDAKGDEPTMPVYNWLLENHPRVFAGAIIERTTSGGIHATFRWCINCISVPNGKGKTYMRFDIEDKKYDVELLTRGSQAVCPPSRTDKGEYVYLTEHNHLNTRRDALPVLPEMLRDANNYYLNEIIAAQHKIEMAAKANNIAKKSRAAYEKLRPGEIDIVIDGCIKAYQSRAREGNRHPQALGLAMTVAGLPGVSSSDVDRAVHDFYRGVSGEPPTMSEIDGIIRHGLANPDRDPYMPMKNVIEDRKRRLLNTESMRRAANVKV